MRYTVTRPAKIDLRMKFSSLGLDPLDTVRKTVVGAGQVLMNWQSDTLSPAARFHCPVRRDELRVVAVFISANDGCRGVVWPVQISKHNTASIITLIPLRKSSIYNLYKSYKIAIVQPVGVGVICFFHRLHTPIVRDEIVNRSES